MHRGPFSLGYVAGMTVNIITVAWLVFAIVFFSFPYDMPVTGELYVTLSLYRRSISFVFILIFI